MTRKYNAYKIIHDTGNGSWVCKFELLNDLIDHCNSGRNIRKTCDLHFYTWVEEKENYRNRHEFHLMGSVCGHNPKDSQIQKEDWEDEIRSDSSSDSVGAEPT